MHKLTDSLTRPPAGKQAYIIGAPSPLPNFWRKFNLGLNIGIFNVLYCNLIQRIYNIYHNSKPCYQYMVLSIVKNGNDRLRKKNMQLREYSEHENAKSSESTHHFLSKNRLGTDSSLVPGVMHERNLVTRLGEIRLSQIYHRCLVCHSLKVVKHGTLWNKIDFFWVHCTLLIMMSKPVNIWEHAAY